MLSMKKFGELISTKRKELGYTQETFAGKLGITPQAVSKWENGIGYPDITLLPTIADVFNMSIDELLGHEAPKPAIEESNDSVLQVDAVDESDNDISKDDVFVSTSSHKNIGKDIANSIKLFVNGFGRTSTNKSNIQTNSDETAGFEERLSDFSGIVAKLCNSCDVIISNEGEFSISASGCKKFIDSISYYVKDGKLRIDMKNYPSANEHNRLDISVAGDKCDLLDVSASGCIDLRIEDVDFDTANLVTGGACDVDADVNIGKLVARFSGASDFTVRDIDEADIVGSGACNIDIENVFSSIKAVLSGSSDIDVENANNAEIRISGTGDANIGNASGNLTVSLSGSSYAGVSGSVANLCVSVSGNSDFSASNLTAERATITASGPSDVTIGRVIGEHVINADMLCNVEIINRG